MKRSIVGRVAIALAALAVVPAAQAQTAGDTLRFGVAAEPYPPFLNKTPGGGWVGFEPDLVHALCAQMKAKCEIREVAWDGIIAALQSDKIDVIFNSMNITPEREKVIAFSRPYYETPKEFVGPRGASLVYSPEGLKGKVIGVEGSTVHAEFIKKTYGSSATVRLYNTQADCNADLVAGRIDAMFVDELGVLDFLKSPQGQSFELKGPGSVKMDPAVYGRGVGAGIRKSDVALRQRIDAAIDALHQSGQYAQIEKKYFTVDIWPH